MAEEKENQLIRAWLLVNTDEHITDENWPRVKEVFERFMKEHPNVIRADWVEGTYDLIIPVEAKDDEELDSIKNKIESLKFSPNGAKVKDTAKVKEHNPEPPALDPLKHNEWG